MINSAEQRYHDKITTLFDDYYKANPSDKPSIEDRNRNSNDLIEDYFNEYEATPPDSVLSRLATYILLDTLTDSHPDKMSREEYPIMSYGQTGRYFARNGKLKDVPYDHEEVIGYLSRLKDDGEDDRAAIINPESSEQRATNWRLFIREVLTEREAFIIERTYEDGATQAEIAEELGVSQPRVAQMTRDIYDKLRGIIDDIML